MITCITFKNTYYSLKLLMKEQFYEKLNVMKARPTRSSLPEVFCKKDVLKNFAKLTGKQLCHSLFLNKVAGLRSATLLKKRLWHRCFPLNFAKFLRTPFLQNTPKRLLLFTVLHYFLDQKD